MLTQKAVGNTKLLILTLNLRRDGCILSLQFLNAFSVITRYQIHLFLHLTECLVELTEIGIGEVVNDLSNAIQLCLGILAGRFERVHLTSHLGSAFLSGLGREVEFLVLLLQPLDLILHRTESGDRLGGIDGDFNF